MRDYVIINGVSSERIRGLLIQQLPPITKPKMRTQVETVDGRDGDIVTKLGFSAYDKEILIGLYGQYDVDEIIAFFAASGTIVFSNEPQKYYRFEQLEGVDYEKLIRWKQAKVKFHVQPFKYSAIEKELEFDTTKYIVTETGSEITFNDVHGGHDLIDLTVNIVPQQSGSGDPSPTNIRPITGWTGATVTRTGNNLLEPKVFTSGTGFTNPVKVDFSKYPSYTFSCNISTDICRTMIYGYSSKSDALGDVNKIARTAGTTENVRTISRDLFTYEVTGDVDSIKYIAVRFYGSSTTAQDLNNGEMQVEIGSAATAFEPYNGASYPVTWSEAGTVYGGTLDVINGILTKEYDIVDLGTRNWSYNSSIGAFYSSLPDIITTGYTNAMKAPIVCDKYVTVAYYPDSTGAFGGNDKCVAFAFQSGRRLYVKDSAYTDVATFNAAISGAMLVYKLAESVTYQLTPTEITTLIGENNIWADCGEVTITRYSKNEINVRNSGNYISKPIITVEGSGTAWIYINGSQIFQINLEEPVTINTEEMNAYRGTLLANRSVKGDYEKAYLSAGLNEVGWNGDVSKITIRNYSRWY